jgi:hypothetical protein
MLVDSTKIRQIQGYSVSRGIKTKEPDGIENATHSTFIKQSCIQSRFVFQMYCGLHFQFRLAPHSS